jgi:hypothetical protein
MANVLSANFYNRRNVRGLEGLTIRQKFSNHTVASLDYRINSKREFLLPPENSLVSVRWGKTPNNLQTLYGYVNHYETVTTGLGEATRMVVVGTSRAMNSVTPAAWMDTTRSQIVRDIAKRWKMASVVSPHPFVLTNWASGTRTDWQLLKALADEAGYHLWVDGPTVWFLDPENYLKTAASMHPITFRPGEIQDIQVLGGAYIPGEFEGSSRRVQYGLDYHANELFKATSGDPKYPTTVIPTTAVTYADAQSSASAADRQERAQYVLKATVAGRAAVRPGSLIRVESGRVNTDQAGIWLVVAATHELTNSHFTTKIVAHRGADQQPLARTQSTARGAAGSTQAVVRDGVKWEAAVQEQVHV